jgi:hypothetical protein
MKNDRRGVRIQDLEDGDTQLISGNAQGVEFFCNCES